MICFLHHLGKHPSSHAAWTEMFDCSKHASLFCKSPKKVYSLGSATEIGGIGGNESGVKSATTFSIMTLSITTLSIMIIFATLSINDTP
jgi:hypothetical protein